MRIPRFYQDTELAVGHAVELDERAHRHAVQVLRLRVGEAVILFNGRGGEYCGRLSAVERRSARVTLESFEAREPESPLRITLAQGIAKGDHMDFSLQKSTELGVSMIQPVVTERTVGRWEARRLDNKLEHWRGIVVSACEQSGRTRIPCIEDPISLAEWLGRAGPGGTRIVLDPGAGHSLAEVARPETDEVAVLIGPEGGLTGAEVDAAGDAGFTRVRLGQRVLRTETAATAVVTAVQWLWGDLGR